MESALTEEPPAKRTRLRQSPAFNAGWSQAEDPTPAGTAAGSKPRSSLAQGAEHGMTSDSHRASTLAWQRQSRAAIPAELVHLLGEALVVEDRKFGETEVSVEATRLRLAMLRLCMQEPAGMEMALPWKH